MLRQVLCGLAVMSAFAAAPAYGQEVNLKFKFKEGDKFWMEEVVDQKQTMTVMGQQIKMDLKSTTIRSYNIKKVTPENIVMVMKIEDVKVTGGGEFGGPAVQMAEKTKGATMTVTMTPGGKVKKLEGFEEFVKNLVGDDEVAKAMKELLNEETIITSVEQSFAFLPDRAVKKDDTWTGNAKVSLGPIGSFHMDNHYTYNGKKNGGEEILDKFDMKFMPPKDGGNFAGLPFKVVKTDLKGDGKGTYVFDAQKGRLASATVSMQMQGTMKMEVAGNEAELGMSLANTSTIRVLDQNPVKN